MANHIARRKFIVALGSAAAWPLVAHAQQPTMPMVGFLSSRSPGEFDGVVAAFRQGLGEAGFVEGQNVVIAFRWAEGRYDRLQALAAELVDLRVAVILGPAGRPQPSRPRRRLLPFRSYSQRSAHQSNSDWSPASTDREAT